MPDKKSKELEECDESAQLYVEGIKNNLQIIDDELEGAKLALDYAKARIKNLRNQRRSNRKQLQLAEKRYGIDKEHK